MKPITLLLAFATAVLTSCSSSQKPAEPSSAPVAEEASHFGPASFYDYSVTTLEGEPFDLSQLKGKRVLIVNTASECGFTPQYEQLQELYELYGGDDFTIIGFPTNNFGGQEPGTDEEIKAFCQRNYGVTFPMMSKISVAPEDMHPLYQWLTDYNRNGVSDGAVKWNFHKFAVDEEGKWVAEFGTRVNPMSEEIQAFAKGE